MKNDFNSLTGLTPEQQTIKSLRGKIHGLIGMAMGAGFVTVGFDAVCVVACDREALEYSKRSKRGKRRANLVLVAKDLSPKTEKELRFYINEVPILRSGLTKEEIADAIGSSSPVGVVAIQDGGFAKVIKKFTEELNEKLELA